MKSRRTKALEIPQKVKYAVWERDGERCILCGSPHAAPEAHFIPRSKGGLGIEENIVTLCRECHRRFDQTTDRENIAEFVRAYLAKKYPEWDETKIYYRKVNA
jgi:5-methylcytosine-specific restriction endonuclease McrA